MKMITKYLLILIFSFLIINGCDKPAPTQLVQEDEFLEVEIISNDLDDEIYSSGYDSTGYVYNPSRGFANIITVSGIKTSYKNSTFSTSHAQAIFFNRDFPIYSPDGRLIGYETRLLGDVDFNNFRAKHRQFRIRFKNRLNGNNIDTTLGFRHVLHDRPGNHNENFNFEYNSNVNFNFDPAIGSQLRFSIPTASEINGTIRLERNRNNFLGRINWNGGNSEIFEIIVGGMRGDNGKLFPLYRLKTDDDGSIEIPQNLLNKIPLNRFHRLVFSIIRKKEFHIENDDNDLFILSQSIHNLVVDIP